MPIKKANVSRSLREGSPVRQTHSPPRSSGMGNRQMLPMASTGRPRQTQANRLSKRSTFGLGKHIGEESLQRKSSGPLTVGEMIPFQRASRREPHVPSQGQDNEGNIPRRTIQARSSVEEGHKVADKQQTQDTSSKAGGNNSEGNKGSVITHQHQRSSLTDGKQMPARSVRPKVKRPSAAYQTSSSSSVAGAVHRRPDGEEVVEVVSTTTSPRRRIVKRKSQITSIETRVGNTTTRESSSADNNNDEQRVGQDNSPSDILMTSFNSDIALPTRETPSASSNQESIQETSLSRNAGRHSAHSSRVLLRSRLHRDPAESQSRDDMHSQSNIRNYQSNDLTNNHSRISRPPLTAREALARSLSRNGERTGNGRPTIQPSIASATELSASDNSSVPPERETYANSVRRSYEPSRTDSRAGSSLERPRLSRPTISSTTPRTRPRELIDVDSAVTALGRRIPSASTSFTSGENESNENNSPSLDQSTRLRENEVWVPQRRNPQAQTVGNSPRSQGPSLSPFEGRINTPEIVFRDSPVTETMQRRSSRSGSTESENSSSVASAPRPAPTLPNRRGLYRALSIAEDEDINSEVGTSRSVPSSQRRTGFSIYENIDSDDMDMWRSIEGNPSHARQRLIQQDRTRGRDSILNRTTSGRRVVPPGEDSLPDINDNQEFPTLESSREAGASGRSLRFSRETRQEQLSTGSGSSQEVGARNRRTETPPPTPTPDRTGEQLPAEHDHMMEHLVLLASPIFGPLMLQASPAVLFNMLSRARRDFGGEFVELLIENVVLSLLAQHSFDLTNNVGTNGGAPPPATEETIKSLEKVTVNKKMVSEDAFCAICHVEYALEEVLDQLPCKHSFHNNCITIWLKKSGTCPVCRHKLYTDVGLPE